ncbi:MAG: pyruvate dehydrogenase (acetyl-transferring) E1 component subunit alpha [Chloroflexi bacterium]|nr:pyruvate dehydrogenase (acetyl-transferring) E1 component subunit alpha [Ktedonobacteraceae bacterium]MBV9706903.1 pyruvate dehydrogenase (acetyl-transferring) E1 component subunit alpha [Chloroflexota bacterium]
MPFPLTETMHQVMTPEGKIIGEVPLLSAEQLVKLYRWMVLGRAFSDRMVALQRQGRMGTFSALNGQEATSVGLAAPLQQKDWLAGSYREILSYLVKGVPMQAIMKLYRGYVSDDYSAEAHCLPIQIVLATQLPHMVGIAMALKYDRQPQVAVGVCGDGATSEGDFNEALNFAGVFKAPVVFVVQNNGWAISVPRSKQTAAQYIAHRGPAFGMPGYLVDGNDLFAVYKVVCDCVERARAGEGPALIEAITYRLGAHTTADDPKRYRPASDLTEWGKRDPILRFRAFLFDQHILSEKDNDVLHEEVTTEIEQAINRLEALPPQDCAQVYDLVYSELTPQLKAQRAQIMRELGRE